MTATGWDRIRTVLEGALEHDAGPARDAYLARACADDAALLAEVHRLLAQDASSRGASTAFLEPPSAQDVERALAPTVAPGTRVGRYRLLTVLGSGGMGTVHEAEQENPRRRVALKMLSPALASPTARRRFQFEAEILARLRHPGIATVFEVGMHEADGLSVPYYVMELVPGARSIVAYARERGLPLHERAALFRKVCAAVQHGHERGVVHRDLKPGNILVDEGGEPRVIDFGVARMLADEGEASLATRTGQLLGTLRYMSPEQLAGDPDAVGVRSDVYALGVVLYELLCERLPYDVDTSGSLVGAAQVVQRAAPRRPSAARPELSGDAEAVLLMALEKEPEHRYPSVAAFDEDLRRWLAREPVSARPPSVARLLRAAARRHRALALSAGAVLVVLVAATIVSVRFGLLAEREAQRAQDALQRAETAALETAAQARRAEDAQAAAEAASREAERERDAALRARDSEAAARARAESILTGTLGLSTRFLGSFFDRVSGLSGSPELNRDLLEAVLEHLAGLDQGGEEGPELRYLEASCRMRLGDVLGGPTGSNLGLLDDAEREYRAAVALAAALHAHDGDDPRFLVQLADARLVLSAFETAQVRYVPALDEAQQALALLTTAVERWPENLHYVHRRGDALQSLSVSLAKVGELDLAERYAAEWDEQCDALLAADASKREHRQGKAACLGLLADFALEHEDIVRSNALRAEQQGLLEELVAEKPEDTAPRSALGACLEWRSNLGMRYGDPDFAEGMARRAVAIFEQLVADVPGDSLFPRQLGYSVFMLGEVYRMRATTPGASPSVRAAAWAEARAHYERSRDISARLRGEQRLPGRDHHVVEEIQEFIDMALQGEEDARTATGPE